MSDAEQKLEVVLLAWRDRHPRKEQRMETSSLLSALIAGPAIGALGRRVIPGRQAMGWILTFALGLLGAVLGGFLAGRVGFDVWRTLIIQAMVAAAFVLTIAGLQRREATPRKQRAS